MADKTNVGNALLYSMEGAACISVIFIHCMLPSWPGILMCGLARFAVPLFFIVSGYYLRKNSSQENEIKRRAKQKAKRLGRILAWAALLYLVWSLTRAILEGGTAQMQTKLLEAFAPRQLFATIFLGDFTPIGGHLWFLAALLVCYGIIAHTGTTLLKKNTGRLAAALLFVHVAGRFICALLSVDRLFGIPVYIWFRNWLFMGLPFFLLGDWFRQNQETLVQKFSTKTLLAAFSLGVVLTVAETVLVAARTGDDRELYLGIFLMIFALFLLAWKKPRQDHEGILARIGRNYLLEIYLLHLWVMEALDLLLSKTGLHIPGIGWTKPFLVLVVSAALGVVWKKRRNVS